MIEEYNDDNLIQCKITFIGETSVGKSSLIKQYINETFNEEIKTTIGGEREFKIIEIDGKKINLCFWDTAGQEKYRALSKIFVNNSNIVIFVYDITNQKSFNLIKEYWYPSIFETLGNEKVVYGIAANKSDLYENEIVNFEEAEKYGKEINAIVKETTAINHKQINEFINELISQFIKLNPEIIPKGETLKSKSNKKKEKNCC